MNYCKSKILIGKLSKKSVANVRFNLLILIWMVVSCDKKKVFSKWSTLSPLWHGKLMWKFYIVKASKFCEFEISIRELSSKFRYIFVFKMILSAKIKISFSDLRRSGSHFYAMTDLRSPPIAIKNINIFCITKRFLNNNALAKVAS